MSQLTAHFVSRATTTMLTSARSSLIHPAIPLKSTYPFTHQYKRFTTGGVRTHDHKLHYIQRVKANAARLYTRRVLEVAAMSAATLASTAAVSMEAGFEKPKEWATIDLVEQRKKFGESISSLGKTRFSRVWAAGKFWESFHSFIHAIIPKNL